MPTANDRHAERRPEMSLARPPQETTGHALKHCCTQLEVLFEELEPLASLLGEADRLAENDAWQSVRRRYRMLRAGGETPLLIATLYGPTGAGKSTLFRLLTGIPVPAGEVKRPTTRCNVVAVPGSIPAELLGDLFEQPVEWLDEVDRLRDARGSDSRLYYRTYESNGGGAEVALLLADVPDFDTFARENWRQAEAMLRQAHVVVYLCYAEGYATEKNLQELARCCRLAGELIYVFTKLDRPEAAPEFREVLLRSLESAENPAFHETRQDGRTLAEFVRRAPMYYSLRTPTPTLDEVRPIAPTAVPFRSAIQGRDAERIVRDGLREPIGAVLEDARGVLDRAERRKHELAACCGSIENDASAAARRIVEGEFPADRLLAIIQEELRGARWRVLDRVARFVQWPLSGLKVLGEKFGKIWRDDPADEIVARNQYEETERRRQAERLAEHWRGQYRDEAQAGGLLEAERIQSQAGRLAERPLPPVTRLWEDVAREGVRTWIVEHRATAWSVANLVAVAGMVGVGLVAADLVITGGVVGTLGGLALGGAAGPAGAMLLELLGRLHLRAVAEEACRSWFDERQQVLRTHLTADFARPLFHTWFEGRDRLEAAPLGRIREAVRSLDAWTRDAAPPARAGDTRS